MTSGETSATAVYVAYGVRSLDMDWIPDDVPVIVVHNDRELDPTVVTRPQVRHITANGNRGFGAGVNLALAHVTTDRVVLVNPDIAADPVHWAALITVAQNEIAAVPLNDRAGQPTIVCSPYPTPALVLSSALHLGRLLPRGSRLRRVVEPATAAAAGVRKQITEAWASAALVSFPTAALRAVGGFNERFFLYFEDVDLCERLAAHDPSLVVTVRDVEPAVHGVGRSSARSRIYRQSAVRYARGRKGAGWALATAVLRFMT